MQKQRPSLRVVFGRLVFAALPLAGASGCTSAPSPNACFSKYPSGSVSIVIDGGIPDTDAGVLPVYQVESDCAAYCPQGLDWIRCQLESKTEVFCTCGERQWTVGRAPAGLRSVSASAPTSFARFLASSAHLEAAAVFAFRGLAEEARFHGAPATLVRSLERAARDEVRHARTMNRLARAHGAQPPPVEIVPAGNRTLEAIALENAAEGCVYETHAALLATWQAEAASDPGLRRAMRGIAEDETRHAETSWALAQWLNGQLSAAERTGVASARAAALARLEQAAEREEDPELVHHAGLPRRSVAALLVQGLAIEITELGRALDA